MEKANQLLNKYEKANLETKLLKSLEESFYTLILTFKHLFIVNLICFNYTQETLNV